MEYIFIVGAVQAFFLTFMVINKKNKSTGDHVMAIMLLLMGVMLVGYTLEVKGVDTEYPVFLGLYTAMPMLLGPLIYLYISSYTGKSQKFNPLFLLHALPYVFFTVAVFLKMSIYSDGSVVADRDIIEDGGEPIFFVLGLWRIFGGTIYLIASYIILKRHTRRIGKYFSYTENIDLKCIRGISKRT